MSRHAPRAGGDYVAKRAAPAPTRPRQALAWVLHVVLTRHSVILGVAVFVTAAIGSAFPMSEVGFWGWSGAATLLLVAQTWSGERTVRDGREAQEEFKVVVYDQIAPLARHLSQMARMGAGPRRASLQGVIRSCVTAATGLTNEGVRARATFFARIERNGQEASPRMSPRGAVIRRDLSS